MFKCRRCRKELAEELMMAKHPRICKSCYSEGVWVRAFEKRQERLEKMSKTNPNIKFCDCGDYYFWLQSHGGGLVVLDKCPRCKREEKV